VGSGRLEARIRSTAGKKRDGDIEKLGQVFEMIGARRGGPRLPLAYCCWRDPEMGRNSPFGESRESASLDQACWVEGVGNQSEIGRAFASSLSDNS